MGTKEMDQQLEFTDSRRKEVWNKQFLTFSVALFLCITASLTFVTVLSNFALTYQAKYLLFELVTAKNEASAITQQPLPVTTTSDTAFSATKTTISSSTPEHPTSDVEQWTEWTSTPTPVASQEPSTQTTRMSTAKLSTSTPTPGASPEPSTQTTRMSTTKFPASTPTPVVSEEPSIPPPVASQEPSSQTTRMSTEEFSTSTSTSVNGTTTTGPPKLRNPISILSDLGHRPNYTCLEQCSWPHLIVAQLNLSLSRIGDNYLLLTTPVCTSDKRIAQQKAAYVAIRYLHNEHLSESLVQPEWGLPISYNCTRDGDNRWVKCK